MGILYGNYRWEERDYITSSIYCRGIGRNPNLFLSDEITQINMKPEVALSSQKDGPGNLACQSHWLQMLWKIENHKGLWLNYNPREKLTFFFFFLASFHYIN